MVLQPYWTRIATDWKKKNVKVAAKKIPGSQQTGINDTALKIGDTALITFTFSEVPTGFTVDDVTAPHGVLSDFTVTANTSIYTAVFTPAATTTAPTNAITVGTGWTDPEGRAPAASTNSGNYAVDTVAPTISSVVVADSSLIVGETSLVTITFSEPVTSFTNADITTIENGGLSAVSSSDGGVTWTATFTPTPAIEDATNKITVNATGVTDIAGNAGAGTTDSNNYAIDTVAPTLGIGLNDTDLTFGETALITFTLSEVPTGFTVDDVTAPHGNLSGFTVTGDTKVYTAVFTPAVSTHALTNVITVGTGWTDPAGNAPAGATVSDNYAVDTGV